MNKTTFKASSDIALVKYWGKKDAVLRLPENGSFSMILDNLDTVTTVEFDPALKEDVIYLQGEKLDSTSKEAKRVTKHLDRVRSLANLDLKAKVMSENTFPRGTGLSSSASGMAALTCAATKAAGLDLSEKELSILSRQASGSSCRCVCGGFVEWLDGDSSETSYAKTVFDKDYWDLRDVVVIVSEGKKKVSSTQGHASAQTSPFFEVRKKGIKAKIEKLKQAIKARDFTQLGELTEAEALEFHSILLTSEKPMIFWLPGTIQVMHEVQKMREEGIECYFTMNTGFNLNVLTLPKFEKTVQERLASLPLVLKTINTRVGGKPEELSEHLF